jgi:hypothetical protein
MSWGDLDPPRPVAVPDELARSFVRAFSDNDGEAVLAKLRAMTIDREVPPSVTDAELRHHEGARSVVRFILRQIERGSK